MDRFYYFKEISEFIEDDINFILGKLTEKHEFSLVEQQKNSWKFQIECLKKCLNGIGGHILFEYTIPRMGKRVDCIIISKSAIFIIEFKVGSSKFENHAVHQVLDYALDLKNFHKESHDKMIIPILVCTDAKHQNLNLDFYDDKIAKPLLSNGQSIASIILHATSKIQENKINISEWINSHYKPSPTIIEAAQALYQGHNVEEISRSDSDTINLSNTSRAISEVIEYSKANHQKSICFITGVPGAGKTLAGLNLASSWQNNNNLEHAVFLSGNGPLVDVLREALARNEVAVGKENGVKIKKSGPLSKAKTFIQNIHHFRDDGLGSNGAPHEKIVIFDEAQRAWSQKQTASFMKTKKGISDFDQSEPEFLINIMNRHNDWATIVCLIGGGQEINTGEAGIQEWFETIQRSFPEWSVYVSSNLIDQEYTQGRNLFPANLKSKIQFIDDLHLSVSIRSFRSENVAAFVKATLDCDINNAKRLYKEFENKFPIVMTRDLTAAKKWLRQKARGTERCGLIASSGAIRLKPYGINVKNKIEPINWFLNGQSDIRSSYFLEDVATEFDIQGLEIDWTCLAWDADFRHDGNSWIEKSFRGTSWQDVKNTESKLFLKNAYRVLLTRARQGMVIFIPKGDELDHTRQPSYYNTTYEYLKSLGIKNLDDSA